MKIKSKLNIRTHKTVFNENLFEWQLYIIKHSLTSDTFAILGMQPDKTFTPNGDGWNDYFEIFYTNPLNCTLEGKIYDISGTLVGEMKLKELNNSIYWDGLNFSGETVPGGVYIYQLRIRGPENKTINGTVVVAR